MQWLPAEFIKKSKKTPHTVKIYLKSIPAIPAAIMGTQNLLNKMWTSYGKQKKTKQKKTSIKIEYHSSLSVALSHIR